MRGDKWREICAKLFRGRGVLSIVRRVNFDPRVHAVEAFAHLHGLHQCTAHRGMELKRLLDFDRVDL
jgi:hypothetical protein